MNDIKKILKGIGSLLFVIVMALIVAQKINSINELTILGWSVVGISFFVVVLCAIKLEKLVKPYLKLKEGTLEWLSIIVCFSFFGLAVYILSTDSIKSALFSEIPQSSFYQK